MKLKQVLLIILAMLMIVTFFLVAGADLTVRGPIAAICYVMSIYVGWSVWFFEIGKDK